MLHYTYKAIRWRTQISLIITARKSKIIDQKKDESHVGWDVWKSYLQYERHSRIGYDNDGQCHAPVMRNTHDLSGGRATGKNTSSNTHTHLHQLSVCQSLPPGSCRWRGQDAAWWRKEKYTDRCRIARTALQKNILDKPDMGGEEEKTINKGLILKIDRRKWKEGLTVFVAWLSEGFSFGENDGNSQILKGWDVEETGVLVVSDVFGVVSACCVLTLREIGAGHITGTWRQREVIQVTVRSCITWCDAAVQALSAHWRHSLGLGGPALIPALLSHPDKSQDLEAQAGEDLSQNRAEQRARDEAGRRPAPHQLLPRWVQAHWRREQTVPAFDIWPLYLIPTHWFWLFFLALLVKAMMRMMAMSMKRNWKSPRLLRIC